MKANPIAASGKRCTALGALILLFLVQTARAVILLGSGDPGYNTTPPDGALAGSGWQYQGTWGSFLGTPIAPQYFIAAHHVGGSIGQTLTFRGVPYKTTAFWDDPESDLRIWKVDGIFPDYAPLYPASDEAGKLMVVFGRGTQRGEEVRVPLVQTTYTTNTADLKSLGISKKAAQKEFPEAKFHGNTMTVVTVTITTNYIAKGWKAGLGDGVVRWGQSAVVGAGDFLVGAFCHEGGPNQAYLSSGDSSGAVFVLQNGTWKLAGINYGIEGPFGVSPADSFYGAIYDQTGLYREGYLVRDSGQPQPIRFFASRVSNRLDWIRSIVNQ